MTPSLQASNVRANLAGARRLVIKLGSRVLVRDTGKPETRRIRGLVRDAARLRREGRDVVVVTSGAIGTGMQALGLARRPTELPELQMAAAVGQSRLMRIYDRLFAAEGCTVGQVLLTHDDLKHRTRHVNAHNTMEAMFRAGIIPVVNENDVVAVDEIRFGDNDLLASLVAHLVRADLLILLSTTDGLREPSAGGRSRRVAFVPAVTREVLGLASGKGGPLSTGGMASKLESARKVAESGAPVVIADGRKPGILTAILAGADVGTLIAPRDGKETLPGRKRWIAFFHKPAGTLVVDPGARAALESGGRSLLPIGVRAVEGDFPEGAAVDIRDTAGVVFARGLARLAAGDLRRVLGRRSADAARLLGRPVEEAIHRDDLALMHAPAAPPSGEPT
jgi:glutamate 5-kinase